MSIYVGGEKAKLYRGDYGPAQLYKGDVKIAGYTNAEKVGAQISGTETYNDALNLAIEGKSEQTVTVHGKNLFDCCRRKDFTQTTSTWNPDTVTLFVKGAWFTSVLITLEPDTDYYFSAIREGATVGGSGSVTIFVATGAAQSDVIISLGGRDGTFHTRPAVTEYQILLYSAYGTQGECTFRNLSVSKGTQPIPYEPFVPNSPSPDYPSPIRSSESFDVVSCGRDTTIATTAHITDPLRSVGNVSDSIEVSERKVEVVRRCELKAFDGTEVWTIYNAGAGGELGYTVFFTNLSQIGVAPDFHVSICTNALWWKYGYANSISGNCHSLTSGGGTFMFKTNLTATTTVTAFKEWLASQATTGNPVTIQYRLATPTRTDITATPLGQALLAMRTYPHYTQVYTNATLPPTLRAHIKEMEL